MSTLLVWTGTVGPNWDSTMISNGTVVTNWNNVGGPSTIIPVSNSMDEDVAVFNDGGIHTVGGGGSADQFEINDGTTVTLTGDRYEAGAFEPANNADFPDDLVVDDGSKLIVSSGAGLQNNGTVDVVGLGATLFGGSGDGALDIDPGGIYSTNGLIVGDGEDGNGVVTISGALEFAVEAPFIGNGALVIGNAGTGSVSVSATPNVFTQSTTLGVSQGADGSMTFDSSTWGGGAAIVGAAGAGHMTIGAGATTALLSLTLGSAATGSGDLTVTGANSFGVDFLTIGAAGTGTAAFGAGSTGTFAAVTVGESAGVTGNLTMDGAIWNASSLTIGAFGTGHASAGSGEVVTVFSLGVVGSDTAASGDLTIDGASLNGGTIVVGLDGTGTLAVESGSSGTVTAVIVAEDLGSNGTLSIDDSNWTVGSLAVGQLGSAQVTVETGAVATLNTITIGGHGSLAVTEAAGSVGTVIAQQVTINFGTVDLSQFGQMLIGTGLGNNGAVAIGGGSSLAGLGSLRGDVILNGGVVQAIEPVAGVLKIDGHISGSGTIQPLVTLEANGVIDPGVTIGFSPSIGVQTGDLVLDVVSGEQGTITGFSPGNTIDIKGTAFSDAVFTQGTSGAAGTLTLSGSGVAPVSLAMVGTYAADAFTASPVIVSGVRPGSLGAPAFLGAHFVATGTTDTILTVSCFAAGTRIATAFGEAIVEHLRVGQEARCLLRGTAPIVWIGHRRIDLRDDPTAPLFWPVRVRRDAFADGVPRRDLFLSSDHAVHVNGVLIPVRHLINGNTIQQVRFEAVTYYHVELAQHDVLWAEGLEVESYLDTAERADRVLGPRVSSSVARTWEALGCAKLVVTGRELDAVRERLAERAGEGRASFPPTGPAIHASRSRAGAAKCRAAVQA